MDRKTSANGKARMNAGDPERVSERGHLPGSARIIEFPGARTVRPSVGRAPAMTNLVVPDAGFAEEFYMPFEHPALPSQQPETKPGLVHTLLDSAIRLAGKARREPAV